MWADVIILVRGKTPEKKEVDQSWREKPRDWRGKESFAGCVIIQEHKWWRAAKPTAL